jgi:(E)-4-hydroxy-3-methylbut-2-enyl-diphosphate synthase
MKYLRKNTKKVKVGNISIGGDSPITVQTMTKTKTADVKSTVEQIKRCEELGVDIVRVTVNDKEAAESIGEIVKRVSVPIVADIHFNHIFAKMSIEAGVSKVRINPGNIGSVDRIKEVLDLAKERQIPIRIGVNSGSLEKDILEKYGYPTAEALYESAMRHINISLDNGFEDLIISVKSTNVSLMIEAYRLLSERTDFPLHLGVTEAGTFLKGTIKSAIGIGSLLSEGIGDTIRVSLTDDPEREVEIGKEILAALGLKRTGIEIITCPTCGRIEIDLISIAKELEEKLKSNKKNIKIALLGCAVNGPGEAKEADIGFAAGKDFGFLYLKGEKIKKVQKENIIFEICNEVEKF